MSYSDTVRVCVSNFEEGKESTMNYEAEVPLDEGQIDDLVCEETQHCKPIRVIHARVGVVTRDLKKFSLGFFDGEDVAEEELAGIGLLLVTDDKPLFLLFGGRAASIVGDE